MYDFETLTLLQRILSSRIPVRSLAFANDNIRLLDLRVAQCNIWEPSALLQKSDEEPNFDGGTSDSLPSPAKLTQSCSMDESQEVIALACHDKGEVSFLQDYHRLAR